MTTRPHIHERARGTAVALLLLAGCGQPYEPPPPTLTLAPAAMRLAGRATSVDDRMLRLEAGATAEATVQVHQPTVTIIVTVSTPTPEAMPGLVVRLGSRTVASRIIETAQATTTVFRTRADSGEQVLALEAPASNVGTVYLHQVVLTQP